MRLVFTSKYRWGTFLMRGEQIAATRPHWIATSKPQPADLDACDALVVVKMPDFTVIDAARARGLPIIYDALDFWHQPQSRWRRPSEEQQLSGVGAARHLFRKHFEAINPDLIICVTKKMADHLSVFAPTTWLPHHADPRLPDAASYHRNPSARTLLYFGKCSFLREWEPRIGRACAKQGVTFTACDIGDAGFVAPPPAKAMIAVRGGRDGCWLSRNWKSNVKAATAARLGLPLVAWPEAGYVETAPESYWFTNTAELETALEGAMNPGARPAAMTISAEDTARGYEQLLSAHFGLAPAD